MDKNGKYVCPVCNSINVKFKCSEDIKLHLLKHEKFEVELSGINWDILTTARTAKKEQVIEEQLLKPRIINEEPEHWCKQFIDEN